MSSQEYIVFREYSQAELESFVSQLTPLLQSWHKNWFSDRQFEIGRVERAYDIELEEQFNGAPYTCVRNQSSDIYFCLQLQEIERQLLNVVDEAGYKDCEFGRHVALKCREALAAEIDGGRGKLYSCEDIDTKVRHFGGGYVFLELLCGGSSIYLIIGSRLVDHFVGYARPVAEPVELNALRESVAEQMVSIRAELTQVELSVGNLSTLKVGDVVDLAVPLNHNARLLANKDQLVAKGEIGLSSSKIAIRVKR